MTIHIDSFDVSKVKKGSTITIFGMRGSGKTETAKWLCNEMYNRRGIRRFVVLMGNVNREAWSDVVDDNYIHKGSMELLKKICSFLRKEAEVDGDRRSKRDASHDPTRNLETVIVLDDMGSQKKFMRSDLMSEIYANGRHWNLTLISLVQHFKMLNPSCRQNTQYLIAKQTKNIQNMKDMYDSYLGMTKMDKPMFMKVFRMCTKNFGSLVIDVETQGTEVRDIIFYKKLSKDFIANLTKVTDPEYEKGFIQAITDRREEVPFSSSYSRDSPTASGGRDGRSNGSKDQDPVTGSVDRGKREESVLIHHSPDENYRMAEHGGRPGDPFRSRTEMYDIDMSPNRYDQTYRPHGYKSNADDRNDSIGFPRRQHFAEVVRDENIPSRSRQSGEVRSAGRSVPRRRATKYDPDLVDRFSGSESSENMGFSQMEVRRVKNTSRSRKSDERNKQKIQKYRVKRGAG